MSLRITVHQVSLWPILFRRVSWVVYWSSILRSSSSSPWHKNVSTTRSYSYSCSCSLAWPMPVCCGTPQITIFERMKLLMTDTIRCPVRQSTCWCIQQLNRTANIITRNGCTSQSTIYMNYSGRWKYYSVLCWVICKEVISCTILSTLTVQ